MSQISDNPGLSATVSKKRQSPKTATAEILREEQAAKIALDQSGAWAQFRAVALSWLPSSLALAGLIGLAWLGHHNDWKLPAFASAGSSAESLGLGGPAWCDEHGVPEAECINCLTGLIEDKPPLNFCAEHGVHGCVLDNPALAETSQPAEVLPADLERAKRALAIRPRRENLSLSQLPGTRIQFASAAAMRLAGVDVEPVERRDISENISTAGEIVYDATRTAQVSPPVDGIVRYVGVNVGDWVRTAQVLAWVDSEKVGRMKSELLSSLSEEQLQRQNVARLEPLAERQVIAGKRLLEAQAALRQAVVAVDGAMRALRNLGLEVNSDHLRALEPGQAAIAVRNLGWERSATEDAEPHKDLSDNWIAVSSPLEGRVVQRNTVVGEVVSRGTEMFRISDTRTVWMDLRVSAEDARLARLGQLVRYRPDGTAEVHRGRVIWISSDVDAKTRTVRVRAELDNPDGRLRNESFGTGDIVLREEQAAIVVPSEAVQWDGENTLVFVRDKRFFEEGRPKFFVARSVRVGVTHDGFTEIIAGVLPGEVVASSGSDVLRAQLLKSNLGAGCTCGH